MAKTPHSGAKSSPMRSLFSSWLRFPLFLLCGALGVLSFAPFEAPLLLPVGQAVLFAHLYHVDSRQGFLSGYAYGLGLMGAGVSWLQISLVQFAGVNLWMSIAYTLAFIAFVALYYALAGWLIARLSHSRRVVGLLLISPAIWVLLEWLRGWLLTGFPWLATGYAMIDTPLSGYAVVMGVYGVSWIAALLAGLLALITFSHLPHRRLWAALAVVLFMGGWGLRQISWSERSGEPFQVSLIQANIEQQYKWDVRHFGRTMTQYLNLTDKHWESDLIIWPETAVSAYEHSVRPYYLDPLEEEAKEHGSEILLGVPVMQVKSKRYFNTVMNLGGEGGYYAKRHLVPFGEYAPFRSLLKPFVDALGVPMSDFAPGAAERPLLRVLGHQAGMSICYEDAFGSEMIEALPDAAFLVNVTNDGWFGDSFAPYQHLVMARMRALEDARYLLRSTNTGVSAVIGPDGGVRMSAPMFEEHVLTSQVEPLKGATPYVRVGNWLIVGLLLLIVTVASISQRRPSEVNAE
jgi:apolipoprotein N-acyltransferase